MTDQLTLTGTFEGPGVTSEASERIETEIYDAIHDNVTTKADLRDLEQRLKIWLGSLTIAAGGALFAALQYWQRGTSERRSQRFCSPGGSPS
jgi:hypothetical protein